MSKNEIFCPLECGLKILDLEKHLQKCKRKNIYCKKSKTFYF